MSETIRSKRFDGTRLVVETDSGTRTYDSRFLVAAFLIYVARGSGRIEPEEAAKMIDVIEAHFRMQGAESLELLTRVMTDMAENPDLTRALLELAPVLTEQDKEDIAVMALKVIAADGRREVSEMEKFNEAVEAIGISPTSVHRAFDRYFSETMSGT